MTNYVLINTNVTSVTLTDDEVLQIAPNVYVADAQGGAAVDYDAGGTQVTGDSLDIEGYASGLYALDASYDSGSFSVNVGLHGSATGLVAGIVIVASSADNSGQTLTNAGYIYGSVAGLSLYDNEVQIFNSGQIGGKTAIDLSYSTATGKNDVISNSASGVISGQIAIDHAGSGLSLVNAGTISATGSTHVIGTIAGGATISSSGNILGVTKAIDLGGGGDKIINSGRIAVTGQFAIDVAGGNLFLNNSGNISAALHTIAMTMAGPASTIINQIGGVISASGTDDAINDTLGAVTIVNHGEIDGAAILGAGSSFNNSGTYDGQVDFGGVNATVYNRGDLSYEGASYALLFAGGSASDDRFTNAATGVVYAADGEALLHGASGSMALFNHGEIFGAVSSGATGTDVTNTGTITGNVGLTASSGLVVNQGLIEGDVTFAGTGNIYRGQTGKIDGTIFGAGVDGRYVGGAGDDTFNLTASGAKYLSGGAGDDTFIFTASGLNAATTVIGGDGVDALTFTTAGSFSSSAFAHVSGIETINLANAANVLSLTNALVGSASNAPLTVNGGGFADKIDASPVTAAADTVTIYGGGGGDTLTAGGAKDIFGYKTVGESTGSGYDTIVGANLAVDRFDTSAAAKPILAINTAVTTGPLSTATFNSDLASALPAADLGAHDAVLFTPSSGGLAGQTFLVIDANGAAGYQATADFVIRLSAATGTLTTADFI